jgi:hypothetical protein
MELYGIYQWQQNNKKNCIKLKNAKMIGLNFNGFIKEKLTKMLETLFKNLINQHMNIVLF